MVTSTKQVAITYSGSLAKGADVLTVRWSDDDWNSATDTPMTRQGDASWRVTVILPASASVLTMAFYNQSGTWDNNGGKNYNPSVAQQ